MVWQKLVRNYKSFKVLQWFIIFVIRNWNIKLIQDWLITKTFSKSPRSISLKVLSFKKFCYQTISFWLLKQLTEKWLKWLFGLFGFEQQLHEFQSNGYQTEIHSHRSLPQHLRNHQIFYYLQFKSVFKVDDNYVGKSYTWGRKRSVVGTKSMEELLGKSQRGFQLDYVREGHRKWSPDTKVKWGGRKAGCVTTTRPVPGVWQRPCRLVPSSAWERCNKVWEGREETMGDHRELTSAMLRVQVPWSYRIQEAGPKTRGFDRQESPTQESEERQRGVPFQGRDRELRPDSISRNGRTVRGLFEGEQHKDGADHICESGVRFFDGQLFRTES